MKRMTLKMETLRKIALLNNLRPDRCSNGQPCSGGEPCHDRTERGCPGVSQ